jgi:serine/threonine protein kinase
MLLEVGENETESESEEKTEVGSISNERRRPEIDIQAFASILFELLFGRPPQGDSFMPASTPDFVCTMIESMLSPIFRSSYSFNTILEILKENNFQVEDGVDSAEVSKFVNWVESSEPPEK